MTLEAAQGLVLRMEEGAPWRVAWGSPDWLGPVGLALHHRREHWAGPEASVAPTHERVLVVTLHRFEGEDDLGPFRGVEVRPERAPLPLRTTVRAYATRPVLVFRTEACGPVEGLASGAFAEPSVAWPWLQPARRAAGGLPEGAYAYGHQYIEFAFPTFAGPELADFFLFPHRPAIVQPLWLVAPDGRSLLLAPLDAFHEQVIAVPSAAERGAEGVRCGWHGDLDSVPRGFASELALWAGTGPRRVLEEWAACLRQRHGTRRPSRYADPSLARLSYWTDNGAAYWYRSEPGLRLDETLEKLAASLREQEIPVGAFELDSWFYPHQLTRPVCDAEPGHVPPTGLLRWEPRTDVLPEGVVGLRRRLGDPPLVLHCRHLSSRSPYLVQHPAWVDGERAHPVAADLFGRWLEQAASWGAVAFEQDWLVESFLGVRGLRERPGRARAWQEALDRAAADHGLALIWCMASPADFFQTVSLERVHAIRTSGDYRYLAGNAAHWVGFLHTNALARALGLHPFKDVFLSRREGTGWEGDPHAEAEALLAALSAGPVGIGDRIGGTDRDLVLRTCRADGILVKPDVPLAALERCFRRNAFFHPEPLIGETHSRHPAGRWIYLASFHAWRGGEPLRFEVALADLGLERPEGPVLAYDWRRGAFERLEADASLALTLAPHGWDLRVLCPLLEPGVTVFGDVSRYASVGDRRVRAIRCEGQRLELDVLGAPGEAVAISGWSGPQILRVSCGVGAEGAAIARAGAGGGARPRWEQDPVSGRWRVDLVLPARGWEPLRLDLGAAG